jgi:hypothetical protein
MSVMGLRFVNSHCVGRLGKGGSVSERGAARSAQTPSAHKGRLAHGALRLEARDQLLHVHVGGDALAVAVRDEVDAVLHLQDAVAVRVVEAEDRLHEAAVVERGQVPHGEEHLTEVEAFQALEVAHGEEALRRARLVQRQQLEEVRDLDAAAHALAARLLEELGELQAEGAKVEEGQQLRVALRHEVQRLLLDAARAAAHYFPVAARRTKRGARAATRRPAGGVPATRRRSRRAPLLLARSVSPLVGRRRLRRIRTRLAKAFGE